mmetsp:Transcript_24379/g.35786  ORF Transcript_24379/g.35786 Transcript_24379/m.35786 type:complete len:119 (-) Transcript_24379:1113-1469(-)
MRSLLTRVSTVDDTVRPGLLRTPGDDVDTLSEYCCLSVEDGTRSPLTRSSTEDATIRSALSRALVEDIDTRSASTRVPVEDIDGTCKGSGRVVSLGFLSPWAELAAEFLEDRGGGGVF